MGTYKGATDFVTKWLWPRPAFHVTKLCARLGITPNAVTAVSLVMVIAAFYWFLKGNWLPGLIAAWLMTFLDTVDGKLARVTMTLQQIRQCFRPRDRLDSSALLVCRLGAGPWDGRLGARRFGAVLDADGDLRRLCFAAGDRGSVAVVVQTGNPCLAPDRYLLSTDHGAA